MLPYEDFLTELRRLRTEISALISVLKVIDSTMNKYCSVSAGKNFFEVNFPTKLSSETGILPGQKDFRPFYTINQAARLMKIPAQKVYYAARTGLLKAAREGGMWLIHIDNIRTYQEGYLAKSSQES